MTNRWLYSTSVPFSLQELYGVKYSGRDGWEEPEGTEYGDVRELITGVRYLVGYGGKHTWDDWGAYWTDVTIEPPETETYYVDIPARMGYLDLSEVLTGAPVYKNRNVGAGLTYASRGGEWHERYSDIMDELHGRNQEMIYDSDPAWYYTGRATVTSTRESGTYSTFEIDLNADPYKYSVNDSLGDWLWDPFDLEDGVILELGDIVLSSGSHSVSVYIPELPEGVTAELWGIKRNSSAFSVSDDKFAVYLYDRSGTMSHTVFSWIGQSGGTDLQTGDVHVPIPRKTLTSLTINSTNTGSGGSDATYHFALYFREKRL